MILLHEAINYSKYETKLQKQLFDWFCAIDPTTDKKYASWIIFWFFKEYEIDARATCKQPEGVETSILYPLDAISLRSIEYLPYTPSKIVRYKSIDRFLKEDFSKVTDYLEKYNLLKTKHRLNNESENNIMNIKGFVELGKLVDSYSSQLDVLSEEMLDKTEYNKWYEDSSWLVVIPLTERASKKYGANTKWCTASENNNRFDYYSAPDTPLIIIINKGTDEKWQLHFDTDQWMDAEDDQVEKKSFIESLPSSVKSSIFMHSDNILFHPNLSTLISTLAENPEFKKEVRNQIEGLDIMNLDDISVENNIDSKFIKFGLQDYATGKDFNYGESYSYGYDNPGNFINDEPDGEEEDEEGNKSYSEDQKTEAGQAAESEALDEELSELERKLSGSVTSACKEYGRKNVENMFDCIVDAIFSEGEPKDISSIILTLIFISTDDGYSYDRLISILQKYLNIMNSKEADKFQEAPLAIAESTLIQSKLSPLNESKVNFAPNGKLSNLSPELWELVRTSSFKNWFGDWENSPDTASKIVDENGEPLIVYHGTDKSFEAFNTKDGSKGKTVQQLNFGSHFTVKKDYAEGYSKVKNTLAVFLNIRSVLDLTKAFVWKENLEFSKYYTLAKSLGEKFNSKDFYRDQNGELQDEVQIAGINHRSLDKKSPNKVKIAIQEAGFDGVQYEPYNMIDTSHYDRHPLSFIALSPSQIKSATINKGNFNPKDDRMSESTKITENIKAFERFYERQFNINPTTTVRQSKKLLIKGITVVMVDEGAPPDVHGIPPNDDAYGRGGFINGQLWVDGGPSGSAQGHKNLTKEGFYWAAEQSKKILWIRGRAGTNSSVLESNLLNIIDAVFPRIPKL